MKRYILLNLIRKDKADEAREILKTNYDVNCKNSLGMTPLMEACYYNSVKTAECILNIGGNVNDTDVTGNTPISWALYGWNYSLKKDTSVVQKTKSGEYYVSNVENAPNRKLAEKMLSERKKYSDPAELSTAKTIKLIEILLKYGADPNAYSVFFLSPLFLAVRSGKTEFVDFLLSAGAKIDTEEVSSSTLLIEAINNKDMKMAELLLGYGAKINQQGQNKNTPFTQAVCNKDKRFIKWLIEKGADVNIKEHRGFTALIWTSILGEADIARYLLERGADKEMVNDWGVGPMEYALQKKNEKITELLKKYK